MHEIEPYYNWRDIYVSEEDELSPFYGREYSEFEFTNTIYNFYIHPQWDYFGSPTLYLKVLFADYKHHFVIVELIGEWNDAINNDIMFLKREVIDPFLREGIYKFILIGENVLNFHESDDCYYEEWYEDVQEAGGWIALINFRDHVLKEMKQVHLERYLLCGEQFADVNWRSVKPFHFHHLIESRMLPQSA
ncbi:MAG: hypothetical protein K1X63_06810 [Chitinophagales bacterium]|nr:hypothetical protein [Chitinophagales bacterium]